MPGEGADRNPGEGDPTRHCQLRRLRVGSPGKEDEDRKAALGHDVRGGHRLQGRVVVVHPSAHRGPVRLHDHPPRRFFQQRPHPSEQFVVG